MVWHEWGTVLSLAISVIFNVFHYFCLLGWLLTPESRPDFDDLHNRLNNMLSDPGRYILTVVSKIILQWLFQNTLSFHVLAEYSFSQIFRIMV